MLIKSIFTTPWGNIEVGHDEHFLYSTSFTQKSATPAANHLAQQIAVELKSYFADPHHRFQLSLKPQGSAYQQKVWNALLVIPVGRTLTYGELALKLQSSPRAVGQACKRNPITLFIPCHRVVGKSNLGGYMGNPSAISYKEALLKHEDFVTAQESF
ncbi:methylated-DNA--[protein]-cysteine S-methyltransferase [Legionella shakespearei]|uniref:Methylated DNA protein cysteine S-methyltransferase n=1 Tax=Legionella shakespearei DSM 23087 TaxID=1122169 RepID=A0A0W0Z2N8_9GAMM|nr:methylated-DNA--[protein]-cysteine S-methyltransferase [Legionella shakespearei]KTD63385.1 methylated DNA protein cysteine S- methyltransferase [Legionella shakespearei DSM 23087]